MYSTRTQRRRRRSGCNANANTMTKFKHTTGRILRTLPNGPTLTKVTYEQTRTDEEYVTENEEEQEVERG